MKWLIIILAFAVTGCGGVKKLFHKKEIHQTQVDSSVKTETVITEKADTNIQLPGDTVTGSKPAENILDGDSLQLESNDQLVTVTYDPVTRNIKAKGVIKPHSVQVKINRETRQKIDTRVKREEKHQIKETSREVERKGFPWGAVTICLILLIVLLWMFRSRIR